jgi:hypothetical protein
MVKKIGNISEELEKMIDLNLRKLKYNVENNGWIYSKIRFKALICLESIIEGNQDPLKKMISLIDRKTLKLNLESIYKSYTKQGEQTNSLNPKIF